MTHAATIIGAFVVFGVCAAIIVNTVVKRKKGQGGCSMGCSGCPKSRQCHEK